MELKVWVDGIQRVVCGISDLTTCQEVIYALAHATGKTGRFVMVEKWRTSERSLSPHDKPLELLLKWGEYSNDVQFVLRCLEDSSAASFAKSPLNVRREMPSSSQQAHMTRTSHHHQQPLSPNLNPIRRAVAARGPTPVPDQQQPLKPYFVDASRPAPESGTLLRPSSTTTAVTNPQQINRSTQQHVRYGSDIPHSSASHQTTVLSGASSAKIADPLKSEPSSGRSSRIGRGSLTVLSQSAHENMASSAFGGVGLGNNSSLMESSFSSSDLHNMSGASSLSSGSRRQPVPPSPTNVAKSPDRRRPPPPSYDQVMNTRRNYANLLISPSNSATVSRSGTPSFGQQASAPTKWPANREQLQKIVETQQHAVLQQEHKIRQLDNLIDCEQLKYVDTEKQYFGLDFDQARKEIQQLEVRRVHIKQNLEELRRQDFDAQLDNSRHSCTSASNECAHLRDKTANFDDELKVKRIIADKLNAEFEREQAHLDLAMLGKDDESDNYDTKLVELEELIREKKRAVDTLELSLAKENSIEMLATSLIQHQQGDKYKDNSQSQSTTLPPVIKETTPGVWV